MASYPRTIGSYASNVGKSGFEASFKSCSPSLFDDENALLAVDTLRIMLETRQGKVVDCTLTTFR